jgi:hypothetical protein
MKKIICLVLLINFISSGVFCAESKNVSIERLIHTFARLHNIHPYEAAISLGSSESTQWLIEQSEAISWLQNNNGSNRTSKFHKWLVSIQKNAVYKNKNYELSNFLSKITSYVVAYPTGMNGYLFHLPGQRCC